jgi:hypothetical protein
MSRIHAGTPADPINAMTGFAFAALLTSLSSRNAASRSQVKCYLGFSYDGLRAWVNVPPSGLHHLYGGYCRGKAHAHEEPGKCLGKMLQKWRLQLPALGKRLDVLRQIANRQTVNLPEIDDQRLSIILRSESDANKCRLSKRKGTDSGLTLSGPTYWLISAGAVEGQFRPRRQHHVASFASAAS